MDVTFQKKMLLNFTFDPAEVEDFINDQRLLALASIKFQNNEEKQAADEDHRQEIKDMVAYLLN